MRTFLTGLVLATVAAAGAPAMIPWDEAPQFAALAAQDRDYRDRDRRELAERVWETFYEKAGEALELSEAELDELRAILREYRQPRLELHRDRRALRSEKEDLGGESGSSDEEALRLMERRTELRERELEIKQEEEEELMDLLGPAALLEFQDFRDRFNKQVERLQMCGDYRDGRSSR